MGQTAAARFDTFLHEILHAIEYEYGIEIPHPLVHALEEPIRRLLVENGLVL